jgi:hypothetical protein
MWLSFFYLETDVNIDLSSLKIPKEKSKAVIWSCDKYEAFTFPIVKYLIH